jgi:plastocyanin domain-containing protein
VTLGELLLAIAGLLAIGWAVRLWEAGRTQLSDALPLPSRQEATVVVGRAYAPNVIVIRQGRPVRLKFIRQGTAACSQEVVFPDLARRVRLYDGELAMVDFTPERAGEYEFTSGTGTLRGRVIAR